MVETSRTPYLSCRNKELQSIRSMDDPYYEYDLPDEVAEEWSERERERRQLKHLRAVTITDLQDILSKARNWREYTNAWDWLACATVLTGRRAEEILTTLEWEPCANPNTAMVRGILKQGLVDAEYPIPLLCPYQEFEDIIQQIRAAQLVYHGGTMHRAVKRVFGRWLNHTERRNIYCEAAYRCRHESQFYPDASKVCWFDLALCHANNVAFTSSNLTYQALTFADV
jgi:hypothetical protein